MIREARIASRSSIAVDLKLREIDGSGAYDLSVLEDMDKLLNELLSLRDLEEVQPETRVIDSTSAKRMHAFLIKTKNEGGQIKDDLEKIEWAREQVRNVQEGNISSAEQLPLYLTKLSGLLLSIE